MNTNLKIYLYIGVLTTKSVKILLLNECSYILKFSDLQTYIRFTNKISIVLEFVHNLNKI